MTNRQLSNFLKKIDFKNGCWIWKAALNNSGYGIFGMKPKLLLAHRVSYELFVSPIPYDLVIDHVCKNTKCVNPEHLRLLSHAKNSCIRKGGLQIIDGKEYCQNRHLFYGENIYIEGKKRRCRICRKAKQTKPVG